MSLSNQWFTAFCWFRGVFSLLSVSSSTSLLFGSHTTMLSLSILKINIGQREIKLQPLHRAVFSAASPFLSKYLPVSLFPFLSRTWLP